MSGLRRGFVPSEPLGDAFAVSHVVAGFALVIGLVFCWFSHQPLWHTDLWGHLAYGRVIHQSGSLPATEPLMPLSEGISFMDTAWLSQVIGYASYERFGFPGIQFLYAGGIAGCLALLSWGMYRESRSFVVSVLGCALFLWVNWQQLAIVRPQLAGLVCFVFLLVLLSGERWRNLNWILGPALFVAWANLHGSFPIGLALLVSFGVGRVVDLVFQSQPFSAVWKDVQLRRYLLMGLMCGTAVLVNPYGVELYREVLRVASHPNLADLVEWEPLQLGMKQGQAAAAAALALMVLYWFSPRRITSAEVLLLVGLGAGCLWASRVLIWWAPVAGYCFVLHGGALWKQLLRGDDFQAGSKSSRTWTVVTLGLVWVAFGLSPFGMSVLYGAKHGLNSRESLSEFTPVDVADILNEYPPRGQIFNTYEWGDYLLWAGPEGLKTFVASHAHLVHRDVWQSYLRISRAESDWSELLDRYGVNTVVIDSSAQIDLADALSAHADWSLVYEDDLAVVFVRRSGD